MTLVQITSFVSLNFLFILKSLIPSVSASHNVKPPSFKKTTVYEELQNPQYTEQHGVFSQHEE